MKNDTKGILNFVYGSGGILVLVLMKHVPSDELAFLKALAILCSSLRSTIMYTGALEFVLATKLQYLLSYGIGSKSAQLTTKVQTESRKPTSFFSRHRDR